VVWKPIGYSPAEARVCLVASRPAGNVSHWLAARHKSTGNKMLSASLRKVLCDVQFVYSAQKIAVDSAEQQFLS
jgi:hypothetical protein